MDKIKVQNEEYVVGPNDPLPDTLSTEYEETFAKLILEKFYPKQYCNLSVDGEKPDLRNIDIGVGIEVTSSENEKNREIGNLYNRKYIHGDDNMQKEKALKQIKKLGGKVKKYFLIHPTINRDLGKIYTAVKNKTKKLNNDYEIFNENDLFIFDTIIILDQELPEILKYITKSSTGNISFKKVFVYCFGGNLYEFNIEKGTYKQFKKSDRIVQQLAIDTRQMLIEKYRQS